MSVSVSACARLFWVFLRLGFTSFGGPVAHLAYFHEAFVERRKWMSDAQFADLVALCQFLPGPASSQVNFSIGYMRAGWLGALLAWAGFTLPSALALIAFAVGLEHLGDAVPKEAVHALKLVAVAVVALAVWGMGQKLCKGKARMTLMLAAAVLTLLWQGVWGQVAVILAGGVVGWRLFAQEVRGGTLPSGAVAAVESAAGKVSAGSTTLAWGLITAFFVLLFALPPLAQQYGGADYYGWALRELAAFYKTGALVFGGGHVVLPLLQAEVTVPAAGAGWVSQDAFLAGYGAAQAVPGPLFTFAAFLGASMEHAPNGWAGGLWCLFAIYLPSFLLVMGVLPFWEKLRLNTGLRAALQGVNAVVVGILLATLYTPVFTLAVRHVGDVAWIVLAFLLLKVWKLPPWLVVIGGGVLGALAS